MPSTGAYAFALISRLATIKKRSAKTINGSIAKARQKGAAKPSASMRHKVSVSLTAVDGREVYTLRPRNIGASSQHILYFHGGSYVYPILSVHWNFLQHLVVATGCTITVPLYPLAPESNGLAALEFARKVHRHLISDVPATELIIMGDSAGGGLASALALALRDEGSPLPARLILISPFMDVALIHPTIDVTTALDPMLIKAGLQEAGRLYAGDLPLDHPYISPLHADPSGLPPITMFAATYDILHHDELLFAEKAGERGVDIQLIMGPKMIHDWPLLPFKEGREARGIVTTLIRGSAVSAP
jgi:acetyl esterase/lipase